MRPKFMSCFLALVMAMFLTAVPNTANARSYYTTPGYVYYSLPPGYHYEFWDRGPVILNSTTSELVTIAILQNLFPHHHYHPRFHNGHRYHARPYHRSHRHHERYHRPHRYHRHHR